MTLPKNDLPSVRFLAVVIWSVMLAGVMVVGVIAVVMGPGMRAASEGSVPAALPVAAALVNVVLLSASRFIHRAMKAETPTLAKNIVATAVCEAGALFGAVAWMLTGSRHALAGLVMGLGGIGICFPNDRRWVAIGGKVEAAPPPGDRSGGPGFGGQP